MKTYSLRIMDGGGKLRRCFARLRWAELVPIQVVLSNGEYLHFVQDVMTRLTSDNSKPVSPRVSPTNFCYGDGNLVWLRWSSKSATDPIERPTLYLYEAELEPCQRKLLRCGIKDKL